MDWLEFIASIIGSVAWPFGIVGTLLIIRHPLRSLIGRIHSLEVGNIKMSALGEDMRRLEAQAEIANIPLASPTTKTSSTEATPRSISLLDQVAEIAETSPGAAIVFAWTEVEKALIRFVRRQVPSESRPERNRVRSNLALLLKAGKLDQASYALLADMREVRNRAAHPIDNTPATKAEALEYGKLADGLVNALDQDMVQRE